MLQGNTMSVYGTAQIMDVLLKHTAIKSGPVNYTSVYLHVHVPSTFISAVDD